MIQVTSNNRSPAKRLLNNWHDSRAVRTWTLNELSSRLTQAINEGLITREGVERVLNADAPTPPKGGKVRGGKTGENGNGKDNGPKPTEIDGNGSNSSDGQQQDCEACDGTGVAEGGEGFCEECDGTGQQQGEESEQDANGNGESESESEGQGAGEGKQKENGKEKKNGKGNGQDQDSMPFDPALVQEMIDRAISAHQEKDGHAIRRVIIQDSKKEREITGGHHMLPDVIRYIKAGLNVALVGPAGTGKSTIAHMAAEVLEKEFRGCGALLSKYDLVGFKDASGAYHETPLYDAYVNGHLFCFDELDASAPDAVVAFNAITDNQNVYAFPNGMHKKHGGFVAVACMNTWGSGADADYVGRFKQDAAAMSRFVRVYIDYDTNIERQLGDADICNRVWQLRSACKSLGIRHVVSTRMIQQAQAARDAGTDKKAIDRDVLFAGLTESTIKQIASQMKAGS